MKAVRFVMAILASLIMLALGTAFANTAAIAETRVGAFNPAEQVRDGVEVTLILDLYRGCDPTYDDLATDSPPVPRGTTGAESALNARQLAQQLTRQEASSVFTPSGALHPEVLAGSRQIIPGTQLQNSAVIRIRELTGDGSKIADWAKYSTETFQSPSGPFQVHFYRNARTGAANYNIDYKAVFNRRVQP